MQPLLQHAVGEVGLSLSGSYDDLPKQGAKDKVKLNQSAKFSAKKTEEFKSST